MDQIQTHPGTLARRAWDSLMDIHVVMMTNQGELLRFISEVERPGGLAVTMVSNVGPEEPRRDLFRELVRLLHNYVASAGTLVDHTRNLVRRYEETDTYAEYQLRRGAMVSNEVVPFVSKLRNYVLHVGIPAIGVSHKFQDGAESSTTFIDRDQALEWRDWPQAARRYLESQDTQIALQAVVDEYTTVIEGLYRWLYDQFETLHGEDVAAANRLIRTLHARTGW